MKYAIEDRRVVCKGDYYIAPGAIVIGSVILEHNVSIWFNCVVRADNDLITLGEGSQIQDGSVELVVTAPELTKAQQKALAKELASIPRENFEASKQYALGVTVEEVRALTRSEELRRLRLRVNELQRSWPGGQPDAVDPEDSPQEAEMKRLVADPARYDPVTSPRNARARPTSVA